MSKVDMRGQSPEKYGQHEKWWTSLKQTITDALGIRPSNVIGQDDYRTGLYREQLRRLIKGTIEVEVNSEDWDMDYFKEILLFQGKICITDTQVGVIPLECGLHGENVYHRSRFVRIANPVVGNLDRVIGEDCSVIFLMDNFIYWNYTELCDVFANKLAMCDSSIDVNLLNSKVAYMVDVPNQKAANEMKQLYDKINQGEPIVFHGMGNVSERIEVAYNNVKQSYIADAIQTEKRAILNEFMTYIGINNMNIEKKERLLLDEVNGNNSEIMCNMKYVQEMVQRGVDETNKMFPELKLKIKFPFIEKMEEAEEAANAMKAMRGQFDSRKEGDNDESKSDGRS